MRTPLLLAFCCMLFIDGVYAREPMREEERRLEKFYGAEFVRVGDAEHERLVRGALKAQDTGICNVHHVHMRRKHVAIHFGLLVFDDPYYSAELVQFPNARDWVNGGCDFDPAEEKRAHFRLVCPECTRARKQWALAHPKSQWSQKFLARQ